MNAFEYENPSSLINDIKRSEYFTKSILVVSLSLIFVKRYFKQFIEELRLIQNGVLESKDVDVEVEVDVEVDGFIRSAVFDRIDDDVLLSFEWLSALQSLLLSPSFSSEY